MMDTNYFDIYKDVWTFHKKYIDSVKDGTVNWDMVINDARRLEQKYVCDFCTKLIINEMSEFERVNKND